MMKSMMALLASLARRIPGMREARQRSSSSSMPSCPRLQEYAIDAAHDSVGGAQAGSVANPIRLVAGCPVRIDLWPTTAVHMMVEGFDARRLVHHAWDYGGAPPPRSPGSGIVTSASAKSSSSSTSASG